MKAKKTVAPAVRAAASTKNPRRVLRSCRTALPVQYLFDFLGTWVAFRIGNYASRKGNWSALLSRNDMGVVNVAAGVRQ
jgi:hypothetical protein